MLFGASEPPPAFARDVAASSSSYPQSGAAPARSKLRTFGMVAACLSVMALCGLGVAVAFGGENPPPKAAAAPPPPAPPPPPAVTAPPAPEPAPTATMARDEKEEKKASTATGKKKKGGGKGTASSGVITNKTPPPPAAKPVKPADPCGCHGDFNCILACTAGKK